MQLKSLILLVGHRIWWPVPTFLLAENSTVSSKAHVRAEFQSEGIPAEAELAYGEPPKEIVKWVEQKGCDLVAMSTHGHRFLADIFLGTTSRHVRDSVSVPVLLLRAK